MALQGTLDTVPLPDVLSLLASTSKVGRLSVEGAHAGTVWVDNADIVGAECGDKTGAVEVLVALLRIQEGAFRFDAGEVPPGARLRHPIDDALAEATAWLSEWLAVERVLPSPDHVVRLKATLDMPQVTISAADWAALVAVAAGRPVRDLLPHFGATEIDGATSLAALVGTGLVEVLAPAQGARWAAWGSSAATSADTVPPAPAPAPAPAPVPAPAEPALHATTETDDALGNGQPWRDQVRQLLGSAPAADEPPAGLGERFGPAPRAAAPAAPVAAPTGRPSDEDRDVLLKFLSSVQP